MKYGCAIAILALGAFWMLMLGVAIADGYGCDWGGGQCGPEDGWLWLIAGPALLAGAAVLLPACIWALAVLVNAIVDQMIARDEPPGDQP